MNNQRSRNLNPSFTSLLALFLTFMAFSTLNRSVHAAEHSQKLEHGTYRFTAATSSLAFNITNFLITSVDGEFKDFEGSLTWSGTMETSNIRVLVQTKSIDTQNQKRDTHLQSSDFFDVEKFKTMEFTSTKISGSLPSFVIEGNLTLHGVTQSVTFNGAASNNSLENFEAHAKINRQDFGMTGAPTAKNEVKIGIKIHLERVNSSK